MKRTSLAFFLLRLSIASVFAYAAIASFLEPENWIGYFPQFLQHMVPQNILLNGFSLYELALAVWLISGIKTFYAALLSAVTLLGIIVANAGELDVLFRDFAIILCAISLAVFSYE